MTSLQPLAFFITPSFLTFPLLVSMTLLSSSFPPVSVTIPSQLPSTALQPLVTLIASVFLGFPLRPLSIDSPLVISPTSTASDHHLPFMTPKLSSAAYTSLLSSRLIGPTTNDVAPLEGPEGPQTQCLNLPKPSAPVFLKNKTKALSKLMEESSISFYFYCFISDIKIF